MLSQLSVLNNSISFNDYYHAATLDYFWSYITGSNLLNETDWQYLNAADFISFFISEFQKRSFTDTSEDNEYNNESNNWQGYRHFYSSYTWYMQYSDSDLKIVSSGVIPSDYIGNEDKYITMTFEEAICNLMGLFFNMTDEQKTSLTSNLSMDAIKEDLSMYDIWTEVIDEWEHFSIKNNT